jgi:hypothetical protein
MNKNSLCLSVNKIVKKSTSDIYGNFETCIFRFNNPSSLLSEFESTGNVGILEARTRMEEKQTYFLLSK